MIELKNISRIYKGDTYEIRAVDNLSLKIESGEFVSIMGKSGSGKTTILNIIGFLDNPTEGTYLLDHKDVSGLSGRSMWSFRRDNIGFVFQDYLLVNHYTAYENIAMPLEARGIPRMQRRKRVENAMDILGIKEIKDKYPGQISGGQKQRVAIARAIVCDAPLILADEPTGALDEDTGKDVMQILTEINKSGKTVIVVTHDLEIANYTHRIVKLEKGKIVYDKSKI